MDYEISRKKLRTYIQNEAATKSRQMLSELIMLTEIFTFWPKITYNLKEVDFITWFIAILVFLILFCDVTPYLIISASISTLSEGDKNWLLLRRTAILFSIYMPISRKCPVVYWLLFTKVGSALHRIRNYVLWHLPNRKLIFVAVIVEFL